LSDRFERWRRSPPLALIGIVIVTAFWGGTFLMVQDVVARLPVMDFLALRFMVATLVLLALRPRALRGFGVEGWRRGIALGVVLGLGYATQTFGLKYTSATVSGFITGMCVVFTPVVAWVLLRRRTDRATWLAVGLATVGLGFLSLRGWELGPGELLTLSCAFFYALHIVGLSAWSGRHNVYPLTIVQLGTVAIISLVVAAPLGPHPAPDGFAWLAIAFTAVLATAVAFLVQTWAQSILPPARVGVALTMEPVFAGLFGVLLGHNALTPSILIGAVLVLGAMLLTELAPSLGRKVGAMPPAGSDTAPFP
jgi:drug/metabolite transporter (DMT)-like permease